MELHIGPLLGSVNRVVFLPRTFMWDYCRLPLAGWSFAGLWIQSVAGVSARIINFAINCREIYEADLRGESSCCHFLDTLWSSSKTLSISFMRLVMP
jgi:hypothetical protein